MKAKKGSPAPRVMSNQVLRALAVQRGHIEQLTVQLAGCSSAALGATKRPAKKGSYGWSAAYQDVLELRRKYDRLLDQHTPKGIK